jgi:hypothetical protein
MSSGFDIAVLRRAAAEGRMHWHQHALERILERGISLAEIIAAIMKGEMIDVYSADRAYPSGLICLSTSSPCMSSRRPIPRPTCATLSRLIGRIVSILKRISSPGERRDEREVWTLPLMRR